MSASSCSSIVKDSESLHSLSVKTVQPTPAELAILQVLWSHGEASVGDVHAKLHGDDGPGYTSTLKLMQNMFSKDMIGRRKSHRKHVYSAKLERRPTMNLLVSRWIDQNFSGSASGLAMQALDARPVSPSELAALKDAIAQLEAENGKTEK